MATKTQATIEGLYHVPENGKAEIVNGELRLMSPVGYSHGRASLKIAISLENHSQKTKTGVAFGDSVGFIVNLPNRRSFSPDAAYYVGPPAGAKFLEGAPVFAVEVRSEEDYGPKAEEEMAAKRGDYFAAGTLVVWDVDVLKTEVVRVYRASEPDSPKIYHRGEMAEAEPAVPGWTMAVDELFN